MALFDLGAARARSRARAHHPPQDPPSSPSQRKLLTLATRAAEQASLLMVMVDTYVALEKLIRHDRADDAQTLAAKREGLCSLMGSLNSEMTRQVDDLMISTGVLREEAAKEAGTA